MEAAASAPGARGSRHRGPRITPHPHTETLAAGAGLGVRLLTLKGSSQGCRRVGRPHGGSEPRSSPKKLQPSRCHQAEPLGVGREGRPWWAGQGLWGVSSASAQEAEAPRGELRPPEPHRSQRRWRCERPREGERRGRPPGGAGGKGRLPLSPAGRRGPGWSRQVPFLL